MSSREAVRVSLNKPTSPVAESPLSRRVASIDWMRGVVMVFMVLDHASMAFDAHHLDKDSAMYAGAGTMVLPAFEFFTRWLTRLCAPSFVFLMGTALALSVERKAMKGLNAWTIDKDMMVRGSIIALLDPTLISLGSGRWTFQVLLAIGLSMMHDTSSASSHLGVAVRLHRLDGDGRNRNRLVLDTARKLFDSCCLSPSQTLGATR